MCFLRGLLPIVYSTTIAMLTPLNWLLAHLLKRRVRSESVLHISYMVHIPYYTVRILRQCGIEADYLAVGSSPTWNQCDYHFTIPRRMGPLRAFFEFWTFWRLVARYEVIHCHFMITLSQSGWELPYLKMMDRRIVAHYRGCEIRDRERNLSLHPDINICHRCDYKDRPCLTAQTLSRRNLMKRYADRFLVTTPDLKDFAPSATHMPFFTPLIDVAPSTEPDWDGKRPLRIIHATNHPGIEGTEEVTSVIERLQKKGYAIEFTFLRGVPHRTFLEACRSADLSIGKMKMGYYANNQIESMYLGVPAITYVRPEFMTDEIQDSGLIICNLKELEETLTFLLTHPNELNKKKKLARESILELHDNRTIAEKYRKLYKALSSKEEKTTV